MSSAIPGITSTTTTPASTATTSSANTLTSANFMQLMIDQLQNQDPLDPTDSNALLSQMATISQLQSNTQLTSSLQTMTLQQSIGAAGNLIGKSVQGLDNSGNTVSGNVTSVMVQNQQVMLQLDSGSSLQLSNVTAIAPGTTTANNSALTAALNALGLGANSPIQAIVPTAATAGSTTVPATTVAPLAPATSSSTSNTAIANLLNSLAAAH